MAFMDDKDSHSLSDGDVKLTQLTSSVVALATTTRLPPRRNVWLRIDLFLLPIVTIIFFLSFLDKGNIGNARVAGLQQQLHMSNNQYSLALTVTYIPYILVEFPSNLLLKRVGANTLLPAMAVLWGIVTTLQGLVTSYSGLIACRFFLGLFEGGFLPGLTVYLASFYPRQRLQLRISIFFVSTSLAGAFSGLLASAIVHMEGVGGRHGWAWIFILEGLVTVLCGVAAFFLLPRDPGAARFLTHDERVYVERVLHEDGVLARDDVFSWAEVFATFKKPHVLLMGVAGFFNGATLLGLVYFAPSIVAGLGFTANQAQLMTVPPFAVAFVVSNVTSYFSDRYGARGLSMTLSAIISTAGFALFLGSTADHARYGALFLIMSGTYAAAPPLCAWMANNARTHTGRAAAVAALTVCTNSGGVLATWLLGALSPAPRYTVAGVVLLVFQVGIALCAGANWVWLRGRNRRRRGAGWVYAL